MSPLPRPRLPKPPRDYLHWSITADAERTTVNLVAAETDELDHPVGVLRSYTFKHDEPMLEWSWKNAVCHAAQWCINQYDAANQHAQWADELMRGEP